MYLARKTIHAIYYTLLLESQRCHEAFVFSWRGKFCLERREFRVFQYHTRMSDKLNFFITWGQHQSYDDARSFCYIFQSCKGSVYIETLVHTCKNKRFPEKLWVLSFKCLQTCRKKSQHYRFIIAQFDNAVFPPGNFKKLLQSSQVSCSRQDCNKHTNKDPYKICTDVYVTIFQRQSQLQQTDLAAWAMARKENRNAKNLSKYALSPMRLKPIFTAFIVKNSTLTQNLRTFSPLITLRAYERTVPI